MSDTVIALAFIFLSIGVIGTSVAYISHLWRYHR